MQLTENFALKEFESSASADANGINNKAPDNIVANLKTLCKHTLQPAHDAVEKVLGHDNYYIRITSGYRSRKLNNLVGGSPTSFHVFGYAADCELYIEGRESNALLYHILKAQNNYTELIYEYVEDGNLDHPDDQPKWVHVAYDENQPNRKELKYIH